ncbi:MAG: sugar phosphate isomerase/epimerase [Bryobacterales bacterium]|nr:sugar phosphate isomerase/epimerase [Bryobacterales bacterium]
MIGHALLHSVSYSGSWGQAFLPLEAFIDKAAALDYDGVMLMAKRPHLSVLDYDAAARRKLRARLESHNLRGLVIAGYTNFTADLEHAEIPHREIQTAHVTELAHMAHDLGGGIVRIFTGYEHPAASPGAQWNLLVSTLKECARRCAQFPDVTLGLQNHHDLAAGWQSMRDLVLAVNEPNLKPLFDAWAPALHGDNLAEAATAMGPLTAHTTVADYQLRPRYKYEPAQVNYTAQTPAALAVPMGEGFIDYAAFCSALVESGFHGSIAYEMCSPLRDGGAEATLDRYAARFVEWLGNFRSLCENRNVQTSGQPA